MTRVLRRSPLVYPTGVAPGFDPNHVGSFNGVVGQTITSAVIGASIQIGSASGPAFVQPGTNTLWTFNLNGGSQIGLKIDRHIGPAMTIVSTNPAWWQISNKASGTPTQVTWATILVCTGAGPASNGAICGYNTGEGDFLGINSSSVVTLNIGATPTAVSSGITLTTGHTYFIAASGKSGAWNFLVLDLDTGQLKTSTAATAATLGAVAGTAFLVQTTGTPSGGNYNLAATMVNINYALSMQALLVWAADPWSFWYPAAARQSRALKGAVVITAFSMTASTGNYTLAGENLRLLETSIDKIQSGSYALTDEQLTLKKASKLSVQETPYTLTGEQVTALKNSIAKIQEGAYTTTTQPVLKKTSVQNIQEVPYALTPDSLLNINKGSKVSVQEGAYSVTGEQVTALKKSLDKLQTGTYATSSQPVLKKTSVLNAQETSYTLNTGAVDDARSFTAANSDYINVGTPAVLNITGTLTISAWANSNSIPTSDTDFRVIAGKGYDGTQEQYILRYAHVSGASVVQAFTFDGVNTHGVQWNTTHVAGTWYQIIATWDGAAWTLYSNGTSVGATVGTQIAPIHAAAAFRIGGEDLQGTPARFFDGDLADVAVWNVAINSTQISNLAAGRRANTIGANANLVGYWPMLGQSPEPDKSGNGNDGTLTGTAVVSGPPALDPASGTALGNETLLWDRLLKAQMTPYALTGESLTLAIPGNFSMSIGSGTYTLTDNNLTLTRTSKLSAQSVTYALTVEQLALLKASKDFPQAGFYTATGENVTLKAARLGNTQAGSYSLTGEQERLLKTSSGNIQSGSYVLTGESPKLSAARKGSVQAGTYALTDEALTLLKTSKLLASAGNYNLTGENLNLRAARLLLPQMTPFALTGESLTLTLIVTGAFTMSIGSGAYSLTDENLTLLKASKQGLQVGLYSLTDAQLALLRGSRLSGTSGAYTLTGNVLTLKATHLVGVQSGLYGLTGNNLALFTGTPPSFALTARVTLIGVDDISKLLAVDDISKLFGGA